MWKFFNLTLAQFVQFNLSANFLNFVFVQFRPIKFWRIFFNLILAHFFQFKIANFNFVAIFFFDFISYTFFESHDKGRIEDFTWHEIKLRIQNDALFCSIEPENGVRTETEKKLKIFDFPTIEKLPDPDQIEIGRNLIGCISDIFYLGQALTPDQNSTMMKRTGEIKGTE